MLVGWGIMASSQVGRVPCWTFRAGLCMESGGRLPAVGPLPSHPRWGANNPSNSCRLCIVSLPFHCLQLCAQILPGNGWETPDSLPLIPSSPGLYIPCKILQSRRLPPDFCHLPPFLAPLHPALLGSSVLGTNQVLLSRFPDP